VSSFDKSIVGIARRGELWGGELKLKREFADSFIGCGIGIMRAICLWMAPCTGGSVTPWSCWSRSKACLMRSFLFLPARCRFFLIVWK